MRNIRIGLAAALIAAFSLVATSTADAADSVTVGGQTRTLTGTNVARTANALVMYTPAHGTTTRTNSYGFEAMVIDNKVTEIQDGVGSMAIRPQGVVLSGHGTSRTWLKANAKVGATVVLPGETTPPPPPPATNDSVKVGTKVHLINGTNARRVANSLILYTPSAGVSTGTNAFGFEAAVVDKKVTKIGNNVGNMAIPNNGYVLSGHGTAATFLRTNAKIGAPAVLSSDVDTTPPPTNATDKLPDLGIRPLVDISINTTHTPGMKQLRFKTVISNIGSGPIEVYGERTNTTSDMTTQQRVFKTDGTFTMRNTASTMYFSGDGHNHWHVRDLESMTLNAKSNDAVITTGVKHGFCFEDNTSFRDWPGRVPGSPANPVYVGCGTSGTSLQQMMGMSVGWGDTYPVTLPNQYLDITNVPNGDYRLRVKADPANWFAEEDDANNGTWADITINGNTVTTTATGDGI